MITDKTRETFVRLRTSLRRFEVKGNSADRAREKIAIERGEDVWTSNGKGRDTINWRGGLPREESIDHNSFLMRRLSTFLARTLFIRRVISFLATRQHSARVFFYPPVHVEGRRRVVLGRIEAHDDQILWSHPPIKASAHGDWAHPLFLAVYYCTSGHHEWIKTKRGSEVERAHSTDCGCDRGNREEISLSPSTLLEWGRYTGRQIFAQQIQEKAELSLAGYIIVVLIRPREFDANLWSLEVINISIKRNFRWTKQLIVRRKSELNC